MTTHKHPDPEEFHTIREVINDVHHRLHERDRVKLASYDNLTDLQHEQHSFFTHIRSFYQLAHPKNPIIHESKWQPDEATRYIVTEVWKMVRNLPTTKDYA